MSTTSIYLNFTNQTEEAFNFYKSVFGGEFIGGISRMGQAPENPEQPLTEDEKNLVMHVQLPILGGMMLMGTDVPASMNMKVVPGNNVFINLQPDTRAETDELFAALAEGGKVEMPLQDMFWGDYFGSIVDKFGIQWMFACSEKHT